MALAIEAAGTALDAFGNAIATIHKVGEKPADATYASYVAPQALLKTNAGDPQEGKRDAKRIKALRSALGALGL